MGDALILVQSPAQSLAVQRHNFLRNRLSQALGPTLETIQERLGIQGGEETIEGVMRSVTDGPVGHTYWKVANGIRLTGMPAFAKSLSENQMWRVSQCSPIAGSRYEHPGAKIHN